MRKAKTFLLVEYFYDFSDWIGVLCLWQPGWQRVQVPEDHQNLWAPPRPMPFDCQMVNNTLLVTGKVYTRRALALAQANWARVLQKKTPFKFALSVNMQHFRVLRSSIMFPNVVQLRLSASGKSMVTCLSVTTSGTRTGNVQSAVKETDATITLR